MPLELEVQVGNDDVRASELNDEWPADFITNDNGLCVELKISVTISEITERSNDSRRTLSPSFSWLETFSTFLNLQ